MSKHTITIGIPAFNEEGCIGGLLADLLKQKYSNKIVKILVVSDASTDSTIKIAKSYKSKIITVIDRKKRGGKAEVMNQIKSVCKSDALVILDADTHIYDRNFIEKLTRPILENIADLTAADEQSAKPEGWFEAILTTSVAIKRDIFFHYKSGQNFYTCHGQARAFSKKLYQKIDFPYSAGEDLYSYAFCLANGFKYKFVKEAVIHFRLPTSYRDHERQSMRFAQASQKITSQFSKSDLTELLKIPWPHVVFWTIIHFFKNPISVLVNISVFGIARIRSMIVNASQNTWVMVTSTKK